MAMSKGAETYQKGVKKRKEEKEKERRIRTPLLLGYFAGIIVILAFGKALFLTMCPSAETSR